MPSPRAIPKAPWTVHGSEFWVISTSARSGSKGRSLPVGWWAKEDIQCLWSCWLREIHGISCRPLVWSLCFLPVNVFWETVIRVRNWGIHNFKRNKRTEGSSALASSLLPTDDWREAREGALEGPFDRPLESPPLVGDSTLIPNLNSEGDATDSGKAILAAPGVKPPVV